MTAGDYNNNIGGLTGYLEGTFSYPTTRYSHDHSMQWVPLPPDTLKMLAEVQDAHMQRFQSQPKEETKPMRGLFEVFIVNPETGGLRQNYRDMQPPTWMHHVVANDEASAKLKAVRAMLSEDQDPDDYDIIVRRIGNVREKRSVQEVKLVKE